jgi:hypothetical protein
MNTRRLLLNTTVDAGKGVGLRRYPWIHVIVLNLFLLGLAGCSAMMPKTPAFSDGTFPVDEPASSKMYLADASDDFAFDFDGLRTGDETNRYVILISVDGLRPDAITHQSRDELPNFYRLRSEGAFTDNARTDTDYINTLPNHIAQLTGRPVLGESGHNWTSNGEPGDATLHTRKGAYVSSIFDVVERASLRSGVYVSKPKLALFNESYDGGAADTGYASADSLNGNIDRFVYDSDSEDLTRRMIRDLRADPTAFTFLHIRDPDSKGHMWSWNLISWSPYMRAVRRVDRMLGYVFDEIDADPRLAGNTVVILTADHGGKGWNHGSKTRPEDYTIPFYVWGADVAAGDLYEINRLSRRDPGVAHPGFDAEWQPIRNSDAANLAASLLGQHPIPGSIVNADADLEVLAPVYNLTNAVD